MACEIGQSCILQHEEIVFTAKTHRRHHFSDYQLPIGDIDSYGTGIAMHWAC
jgi:hypothetical protein